MKLTFRNLTLLFKNYMDPAKIDEKIMEREFTENEIGEAFGIALKALRTHKGYSIDKLAKLIDMQNSTLNRYENGLRVPSIAQAIKIADYFGLNIEMMLIMGLAAKEGDDIGAMYDKIQQDFEMMRQLFAVEGYENLSTKNAQPIRNRVRQ